MQSSLPKDPNPHCWSELLIRAAGFEQQAEFVAAEALYVAAILQRPGSKVAWEGYARAVRKSGRQQRLLEFCRRLMRSCPEHLPAWLAFGLVLEELDGLQDGLHELVQACTHHPEVALLHHLHGAACEAAGRPRLALRSYERACVLAPDRSELRTRLALCYLAHERFTDGWREFEHRSFTDGRSRLDTGPPLWDGRPVPGARLRVISEQGRGDVIQFARFLRFLPASMEVVFHCYDDLVRLLAPLTPGRCVSRSKAPPDADYQCSLLSLPFLLKLADDSISGEPYLAPPPPVRRKEVAERQRFKVGLVWRGNPAFTLDRRRSLELSSLRPLLEIASIEFISLQHDADSAERELMKSYANVTEPPRDCGDFADTAAALLGVDLVVTVDTAMAHLAGAIGAKTWLLNRNPSHWTWTVDDIYGRWYSCIREFRQERPGDWPGVISRVAAALRSLPD